MNRPIPYVNRLVKLKEIEITDTHHLLNLRDIKPITARLMEHTDPVFINHSKSARMREDRNSQITHDNKILLEKIDYIRRKKVQPVGERREQRPRGNKSLNMPYRRRQQQAICLQNKKVLQRIKSKKPTINLKKIESDWQDNKKVMKKMENYEFYLTHSSKFKDANQKGTHHSLKNFHDKVENIKISLIRKIDGHRMLIKVQFVVGALRITADTLNKRNLKVIDIPRNEAAQFIEEDCNGKVEILFDKLKYDKDSDTLFLMSNSYEGMFEENDANPEASIFNLKPREEKNFEGEERKKSRPNKTQLSSIQSKQPTKSAQAEKPPSPIANQQKNEYAISEKKEKTVPALKQQIAKDEEIIQQQAPKEDHILESNGQNHNEVVSPKPQQAQKQQQSPQQPHQPKKNENQLQAEKTVLK